MIVYLVRHGETAYNRDGIGFGRADVPLTERGVRQAAAVAARVGPAAPDLVVASPLQRALQTAGPIAAAAGVPIRLDSALLELAVGDTEGLSFAEIRERYPEFLRAWNGPDGHLARLPGGESIAELHERTRAFQDALVTSGADRVAVVSHNFVLRVLLCDMLGMGASAFRRIRVDLASVSVAEISDNRTFVRALNDRCHLPIT